MSVHIVTIVKITRNMYSIIHISYFMDCDWRIVILIEDCLQTRSAACIWLVSLLNFTKPSQAMLARMDEIQEVFCSLLSDSDELVQEMASRGVSVVYRLSTESQQQSLMGKLVTSLSGKHYTDLPTLMCNFFSHKPSHFIVHVLLHFTSSHSFSQRHHFLSTWLFWALWHQS